MRKVIIKAYGGELLKRIVIGSKGDTVFICKESEWTDSRREGREPDCVGFPKSSILKDGWDD